MKTKLCYCGKPILLDDDISPSVLERNWFCTTTGVVHSNGMVLSRLIINPAPDKFVDHKDMNTHNNQCLNLREATRSQNGANRKVNRTNRTGYKGVTYYMGRVVAKIRVNGHLKHLGTFDDTVVAAQVYNDAAVKYFGEFARLNVIP